MKYFLFFVSGLFLFSVFVSADYSGLKTESFFHHCGARDRTSDRRNVPDEITPVFASAIDIYGGFLTDQRFGACIFTPSCSAYSREVLQKDGFIRGVIRTFARLLRCHSSSIGFYPVKNNRLFDPAE